MSPVNWITDSLISKIVRIKGLHEGDEKVEVMRYGLYVVISDIIKNSVLLITAYFLGLIVYALFTYAAMGLLKSFIGGVHSKTFWGCLITNSSLVLGISYLSSNVIKNPDPIFFFGSFIICLFTIYQFAPADIENKPIRSKKVKSRMRFTSYSICIIYLLTALYLKSTPFSNIMLLSLLVNSISVLPLMYKLTKNKTGEFYSSVHG